MMRQLYKRFRPLPAAIVVMSALLVVKGAAVLQGSSRGPAVLGAAGRAVFPTALASSGPKVDKSQSAPVTPPAPAAAPVQEASISDSERAVLLDLRTRRQAIDTKEQSLTAREMVLAAAERRIGERVGELTALQTRLEQLEAGRREREDANWRGLTRTYETMRPRDAAAILGEMEQGVLLQVLDRMKEAKAAQVLAAMPPDRARSATALLAQLRSSATAPVNLSEAAPGAKR